MFSSIASPDLVDVAQKLSAEPNLNAFRLVGELQLHCNWDAEGLFPCRIKLIWTLIKAMDWNL
jgi:hypothetical protein